MRVVLAMNVPFERFGGGANRSNRALALGLAQHGHEVHVVSPAADPVSPPGVLLERLVSEGITIARDADAVRYQRGGVTVTAVHEPGALLRNFLACLRKLRLDRVLVSSEDPSQTLLEAALQSGEERVVYLAHTPQLMPFGPASLFPGERRTALVQRAGALVTISRFMHAYVARWAGVIPKLIHPPHDDASVRPCGRRDGSVLLLNGCAVKGIAIFRAVAEALASVRFRALPGYGTSAADRAAVAALPNVVWADNKANLDEVFSETCALVIPSLEGFGMAAVDAIQRDVPVLARNQGGLVEASLDTAELLDVTLIEHYDRSLDTNYSPRRVVPTQDATPWTAALCRLLGDDAGYRQHQDRCRAAANAVVASLAIEPSSA